MYCTILLTKKETIKSGDPFAQMHESEAISLHEKLVAQFASRLKN
jgi:hypothetical protein